MKPNWDALVEEGWENQYDEQKLINFFTELLRRHPESARANFELGNAYDFLGQEQRAIPLYEEAIKLGLDKEFEAYALLQLGSSLRNVGRLDEAIEILSVAEARFPGIPTVSMFLSMALFNGNKHKEALQTLLSSMIYNNDTPDIKRYGKGLEYYIKNL
ncbi:tetratricopeptide repeat protein [Bacillus salacetis]|uniref:tetratricopeptide repeat protein n=1 Tax=Bacillus salacetis TaxID=2315464 RepID=UPI003BA21531